MVAKATIPIHAECVRLLDHFTVISLPVYVQRGGARRRRTSERCAYGGREDVRQFTREDPCGDKLRPGRSSESVVA